MNVVDTKNAADVAQKVKAGELPGPAKTLAEALARIYADGGRYVQKTGQMQGVARYSYAKEGDFIAVIRPLMETHGVTIRPVAQQVITNEEFTRKSGGSAYRIVILATFELLHTSGDKATVQAFGEGQDSGDKGFNKAMTGAMKYALRQTFCVETGDDPDDQPSHEQERKSVSQPAKVPQPAQKTLAQQCCEAVAAAKSRDALTPIYRQYEADAAEGRFTLDEDTAIKAAFKAASVKYPAPPKPAKA